MSSYLVYLKFIHKFILLKQFGHPLILPFNFAFNQIYAPLTFDLGLTKNRALRKTTGHQKQDAKNRTPRKP